MYKWNLKTNDSLFLKYIYRKYSFEINACEYKKNVCENQTKKKEYL